MYIAGTAAPAAKLVYSDSLSLEKTLAEYTPDLVGRIENAETITLSMLLKHRSGIPDFIDHPDYPWGEPPTMNLIDDNQSAILILKLK